MKPPITLLILLSITCLSSNLFAQANVGQQTVMYHDSLRSRPLKTEIWYPTNDSITPNNNATASLPFILKPTVRNGSFVNKKLPLILLSHGSGGNRLSLAWLAYNLVKNGFIVVGVDHWGNTYDNKIPDQFVKAWERPQDISFVLTQLLKDSLYKKNVDENRIGVAGFSLGGYTVIALAGAQLDVNLLLKFADTPQGHKEGTTAEYGDLTKLMRETSVEESFKRCPDLKDNRIKAFFAIAPAIGQGFGSEKQMERITNPVFIVGLEGDKVTPINTNALHYHTLIKNSSYHLITGKAGHYSILNEAKDELLREAKIYYKDAKGVNRATIHDDISQFAIGFFQKILQ